MTTFQAGNLTAYYDIWQGLTSDVEILETVSGQKIEFDQIPLQTKQTLPIKLTDLQNQHIDVEITELLRKGVIKVSNHERGEFISPIFTRPKKDGSHRMILNLKSLNENITYHHFKMDTVWSAIRMMTPLCYMASIDLKDAYYSVPIHPEHQKYLKFLWKGQLYKYVCFPNGLALCPRKFTKLLKPIFSLLRNKGHVSVGFIDDTWLSSDKYEKCVDNVRDTVTTLDKVGFNIHPDKSVLDPTQKIEFLGFVLNSIEMRVSLTTEKAVSLQKSCQDLLDTLHPSIREVARVIGKLTASFPGVMYGPLHYRWLDMDKTEALKINKGNFDKNMSLSAESIADLHWWCRSILTAYNPTSHGEPQLTMTTDASLIGWGCSMQEATAGGNWTPVEAKHHINYLEMFAVFLALKCFTEQISGKHIKVLIDNTTAVACINQMGTCHSKQNNSLVYQIWNWCISRHVWITAAYIPGKENITADRESRIFRRETEWSLNKSIFTAAIKKLGVTPNMDLFASRLNYKLKPYIAYQPDPEAYAVNAFCVPWHEYIFYAFPPFSIIPQVLHKIVGEKATGLLVVPYWPTQSWWPFLMNILINYPIILPRGKETLRLPAQPQLLHPLHKKLDLLLCHLSGNSSKTKEFHEKLLKLSKTHGEQGPKSNIQHISSDGSYTVLQEVSIPFQHLSQME